MIATNDVARNPNRDKRCRMMMIVGPYDGVVLRTFICSENEEQALARAAAYWREFAAAQAAVTHAPIALDAWLARDLGGWSVYALRAPDTMNDPSPRIRESHIVTLVNGEAEF